MNTATFGSARHPFRATLPLRVLRRLPQHEPEVRARLAEPAVSATGAATASTSGRRPLVTLQDVKDFLIAYVACFMAASAWLS